MIMGYARVSTDDQNFSLQRAVLEAAGCKRIFEEKISGAKRDRPELIRMLDQTRDGDVVVVSRLDRLARSTLTYSKLPNASGMPKPVYGRCTSLGPTRHRQRGAWCLLSSPASLNLNVSSFMNALAPAVTPPRRAACASAAPRNWPAIK